jgi:hypothetical protein
MNKLVNLPFRDQVGAVANNEEAEVVMRLGEDPPQKTVGQEQS